MAMFLSTTAALSTFYKDGSNIFDPAQPHDSVPPHGRQSADHRRISATGTPSACRWSIPTADLSYTGNFLNMMFKGTESRYKPNPVLERALEVLFILHLDHEQNCSTTTMRGIGSSHCDPFTALAGAAAALYGPLHGGANEAVLRMLSYIGSKDKVPDFIRKVKAGEGQRLMGFGHRVYKNYDPRARIIKQTAFEVFEVTGRNPAAGNRARTRAHRARRRVLRQSEALPERRLLLRPHLSGHGHSRSTCSRCSSPFRARRAG